MIQLPSELGLLVPTVVFGLPFVRQVAKEIGQRDRWTCTCGCGKRFQDGWLVDIAHDAEKHRFGLDYNKDNGKVLSVGCHLQRHLELLQLEYTDFTKRSVDLLSQRIWNNSLHTERFIQQHKDIPVIENDRMWLVNTFEQRDLDIREFCNLESPGNVIT